MNKKEWWRTTSEAEDAAYLKEQEDLLLEAIEAGEDVGWPDEREDFHADI